MLHYYEICAAEYAYGIRRNTTEKCSENVKGYRILNHKAKFYQEKENVACNMMRKPNYSKNLI